MSDDDYGQAPRHMNTTGWLDPTAAEQLRAEVHELKVLAAARLRQADRALREVERLTDAAVIVECHHPELNALLPVIEAAKAHAAADFHGRHETYVALLAAVDALEKST